jgi:membrane-associated protein
MDQLRELFDRLRDLNALVQWAGYVGLTAIVFAETGLLVGFFLPGDSLLFTAGLFCTANKVLRLSLPGVLVAAAAGALLGAEVGYLIGRRAGPALLDRPDRPRLQQGVVRTREALDRYGTAKAIVLARFIPVVRTVLNPLAGTVGVPVGVFTLWQVVGGLIWALGVTLAGYALGSRIPDIDRYLLPIVGVIVLVSLVPVALELRRGPSRGR